MNYLKLSYISIFLLLLLKPILGSQTIIISSREDNDLYITLKENSINCIRFSTPAEAVNNAAYGSGVMILADDYPDKATYMDASLFEISKSKNLKLYVEYPSFVPGIELGKPRSTNLERVVVTTGCIEGLSKMQILVMHGCHYLPVSQQNQVLAIGKVAGFDRAVYGLDPGAGALLFEVEGQNLLVSTTKLSQFIRARYAPKQAMQSIWSFILSKLDEGNESPVKLEWTPVVRPSYSRDSKLPGNAARVAVQRGVDWHTNAKMLLSKQGWQKYKQLWNLNESNMHTTVPGVNSAASQPIAKVGDGKYGLLEGIVSEVYADGSQPTRWWLRSDSNGESSLAFAMRWAMDGDKQSKNVAGNLLDWLYFSSGLFQNDPSKANYGLLFWAPGEAQALYHDNDIKAILGCIGTSGILGKSRWDDVLVKNILGNFRTTGTNGFRGWRLENPDLLRNGWQHYWKRDVVQFQPHYEAWIWASYLWLFDKTGWKPLLDRTKKGITMMMNAYPQGWRWTNGIQQERGRMLLTLAWLIRVDDRPEYRQWLKIIADDIEKNQDFSGAIREELGALNLSNMAPPTSNKKYGTGEAPLIQTNGDCVADMLYTCNFTFLGLHEAYAATGDPQFKRMADKLASFLIRIQVKSEKHKNLDGGWFRAFDYNQWEYWGSNADSGWGAWSIEVGWTQAWIPTVLAMRELNKNLWDISRNSKVNKHFAPIRKQMIPDQMMIY